MSLDDRSNITKAELPSLQKAFAAMLRAGFIRCSQSRLGCRIEAGKLCFLRNHLPRETIKAGQRELLGLLIRNDDTVVHVGNKFRGFHLPRNAERRDEKLPDKSVERP